MFNWNKSERLRNGTGGIFIQENGMAVRFPEVGDVSFKKGWCKVGICGEVVGSRTQFPLTLMYATN